MSVKTEPNRIGDLVLYEGEKYYSRDVVTVAAGADLTVGAVLGKITANGKYVLSNPGVSDGSENPVAVLAKDAAAAAADVTDALVFTRDCILRRDALNYHADIDTAPERATAQAALLALGIKLDQ